MKLFYSPFHSFIHKALVVSHEAGLQDKISLVPTFPFRNRDGEDVSGQYSLAPINPLDKVPTLALADGQVIFGSQAICEYLDSQRVSGAPLFPSITLNNGKTRMEAITRLALADIMFEQTVQMVMEGWYPEKEQHLKIFQWIWPKIERGLDHLENDAKKGWDRFDIGHVSMLQMISYTDFRNKFYGDADPVNPGYNWRKDRPALSAWFDEATQRDSVKWFWNKDFEADESPEFFKKSINEVLSSQGRPSL
ncbi:glutathione S-transferase [Iodidimonas gelatinilytica]|uniref:Glutathione S-transferase n=1 Tax=Iodidimonas gelatinilytica TaxID=1236966 RepID=A0A5A7MQX2_9PROT|nr:glutathione S-transferase family protein [Iodidimonas gelatinilytica]GEQ98490.1 glutathione S-transferase [Iodidimonas gelatinilytica]